MKLFNPILSKAFIFSDLKYTPEGLYYINKSDNNRDHIFITNDTNAILSLLGLDASLVEAADMSTFFDMLFNNKKININKFFECKDNAPDDFKMFSLYLEDKLQRTGKSYEEIHMNQYDSLNPDFYDLLEESNYWLSNRSKVNKKFNGLIIKKYIPDYDMTKLSVTIPAFKNNFKSIRDFELFVLYSEEKYIIVEFKEFHNIKS